MPFLLEDGAPELINLYRYGTEGELGTVRFKSVKH